MPPRGRLDANKDNHNDDHDHNHNHDDDTFLPTLAALIVVAVPGAGRHLNDNETKANWLRDAHHAHLADKLGHSTRRPPVNNRAIWRRSGLL